MKWNAERVVRELFEKAGVEVGGSAPSDIVVKDSRFYNRLLREASIGLGESYMDGWWECEALDRFIEKLLRAELKSKITGDWRLKLLTVTALLTNMQSRKRAYQVAEKHYDLGNDLYEAMLDPRMVYTCAYWKGASDLAGAQESKLDLVCRKVGLGPGKRVLDLGCGWGGFAIYAAEKYGCEVLGVTIAREQQRWGQERARAKNLPVEIRLNDYREVEGQFDVVVSLGMLEHVGWKNHRTFMEVVHRSLKSDGIALVHTIGQNRSAHHATPFVHKHLFPNAMAPSIAQIGRAMEDLLVMEDWHNFGPDYYPTLMAWWQNFDRNYAALDHSKYDQRFYRLWRFYLQSGGGIALARDGQLWQVVMTKSRRPQPDCRCV
jgi:cyclopropane-fatty-acyl-phospholipid synthase